MKQDWIRLKKQIDEFIQKGLSEGLTRAEAVEDSMGMAVVGPSTPWQYVHAITHGHYGRRRAGYYEVIKRAAARQAKKEKAV